LLCQCSGQFAEPGCVQSYPPSEAEAEAEAEAEVAAVAEAAAVATTETTRKTNHQALKAA